MPIFRSQLQADVLARLFLGGGEVAMSDLSRDLRTPLNTLHDEAGRLEAAGLITSRREGRTRLLSPNAEHPAAGPLAALLAVFSGESATSRLIYRLCPSWRPRYRPDVFVPADLELLEGPNTGVIDPPVNLFWQPGKLDFGQPEDLERFYSSALRRICDADGFATWINARALIELWPRLAIPSHVRAAWETIHPRLRNKDAAVNARLQIQDTISTVIADQGFALARGSALLDHNVVTRDTEDIDAFLNRLDAAAFTAAADAVLDACRQRGWPAELIHDQDLDKHIRVSAGSDSVVVQLVYHQRSRDPERHAGGGLRLVFDDVVGGKAVAAADSPRGRDFDDIAHIIDTRGWPLERVEAAMCDLGHRDMVDRFRTNIERSRRGEFDAALRAEGFDPAFSHRLLDD